MDQEVKVHRGIYRTCWYKEAKIEDIGNKIFCVFVTENSNPIWASKETFLNLYRNELSSILLGVLHNNRGPSSMLNLYNNRKIYALDGIVFRDKEEWFQALSLEDKREYLWSLDNELR